MGRSSGAGAGAVECRLSDFSTGGAAWSSPSRTVITVEQFLQRILRILPRTRSSAIKYGLLQ
jgi:hypothetical protein